jgi:hypothetical protein
LLKPKWIFVEIHEGETDERGRQLWSPETFRQELTRRKAEDERWAKENPVEEINYVDEPL